MKQILLILSFSAVVSINRVAAQPEKLNNTAMPEKPAASALKNTLHNTDYGVYRIVSDLTVAPVKLANPEDVIGVHGAEALVKKAVTASANPKLTANTVVKNTLSGEFGVVSGNLLLVLKNNDALQQLQAQFNLTLVSDTASSKLVLVKAQDSADLKALLADIKASGLVKSIKLDILEKRYHSR